MKSRHGSLEETLRADTLPLPRKLGLVAGILAVVMGACAGCSPAASSARPEHDKAPGAPHWTRVWSDTFAGPAGSPPDQRYWQFDLDDQDFGTHEVEKTTTSPGNIELNGHGDLVITPVRRGSAWTSARIQTRSAAFEAPPGGEMMVTASIKQPHPQVGVGYWPGFWMIGQGTWPEHGEIDILEDVNAHNRTSGTLHCGNVTQRNPDGTFGPCDETDGRGSGLIPCAGCETTFHTYAVIVDRRDEADQQIRWYLDGHEFFSVSENQVGDAAWTEAVDHGFSIILDVAIGGSYPDLQCHCHTPLPDTSSGADMMVRYVDVSVAKASGQ